MNNLISNSEPIKHLRYFKMLKTAWMKLGLMAELKNLYIPENILETKSQFFYSLNFKE